MKEKFFEIDSIIKQIYRKENPIKKQEAVCSKLSVCFSSKRRQRRVV